MGELSMKFAGTVQSLVAAASVLMNEDTENFIFWVSMILCGLGVLIVIRASKKK